MSAVDKRLFYLMLSPSLGQEFASNAGFSPPSDDVQEKETLDILSRWTVITVTGLLEDIIESADWICDFQNLSEDDREDVHRTFVSFGVALVNKVLDSEKVMLVLEVEDLEDLTDE